MKSLQKPSSRKKFILLTAVAFCSASILRFFTGKRKSRLYTVKMLTQDGTLVEVERKYIERPGKKISTHELQHWVKKDAEKK